MKPKQLNRRQFIINSATIAATGVMVTLLPKVAFSQRVHDIERKRPFEEAWLDHYYAYVIDTTKCIGCGGCVDRCPVDGLTFTKPWG